MEFYTLNRSFRRQKTIDKHISAIWTERYYGDADVQLVVNNDPEIVNAMPPGTFLAYEDSEEVMMLESREFTKDGAVKITGVSLMQWMNNRFIRSTAKHEDRYWVLSAVPGEILKNILYYMCIGGTFLDGSTPIGIANPASLKIPGLIIGDWDKSGAVVNVGVPFGPVYDAMKEIATTYEIGQYIHLVGSSDTSFVLYYRNYRGIDRTSTATNNPVRFSEDMQALTDITELQSQAEFATHVWAFAPSNPGELATTPGSDSRVSIDTSYRGFDMRTRMIFAEDITTDQVAGNAQTLLDILNQRAKDALKNYQMINVIDGEIVPNMQYQYGRDYRLGDLVELQGHSGAIQTVRVLEYIRSQDASGERAYPTVAVKN